MKTLPAVAPQKAASPTSSSTRETAWRKQSEARTPTRRSRRAVAPRARLRPSLWTNPSCSVAWSTSSSSSPDSSPCISPLGRGTELRVREAMLCRFQRAPSTGIMWSCAQDQCWSRGSVSLPSLLPASSSWNAPVSPSTSQRVTSSPRPHRKSSLVGAKNRSLCSSNQYLCYKNYCHLLISKV